MSLKDIDQYRGKWVAVSGNEIIASADTVEEVYKKAIKKSPDKTPFIDRIPAKGEPETYIL
jgi:hypothetical protein